MSLLFCIVSVYAIVIYYKCVRANKILSIVYCLCTTIHKIIVTYIRIFPLMFVCSNQLKNSEVLQTMV